MLNATARHPMPFGAELQSDGQVRFRVWAPEAASLHLVLEHLSEPLRMIASGGGWHELTTPAATAGSHYRYLLPSGLQVPDPVSRFQPADVDGPSQVMDPCAYTWQTRNWCGRPWNETILYELHIGTFTPEGTFLAAIAQLDYLADLGITAIEIMSLGDFPGARNWGYDGVLLYAPDSAYGTPDDLKALIDAAHARNLMVILDVVYNHFGPEGNYIPQYFPDIATDRYTTPWGQAINFDARHSDRTREFILHNALYWIEEFRMDGLRLDAVHAIIDSSTIHILDELAHHLRAAAGSRLIHLILESDDTMWNRLIRDAAANPLLSTAQWNHDSKQFTHLGLSPVRTPAEDLEDTHALGRALVEGFTSALPRFGLGFEHIDRPTRIPPSGFISFLQTHDLVGNRLCGERLAHIAPPEVLHALAAIYLLAPQIPMLFMGEEWAASSPFPFFCDFRSNVAEAVRQGRLEQFTTLAQRTDPAFLATIPDPLAESSFLAAKLQWPEQADPPHAATLALYRTLLALRRDAIIPLLAASRDAVGHYEALAPRLLSANWLLDNGITLRLEANLSPHPAPIATAPTGQTLYLHGTLKDDTFAPWSLRWSLHPA